jgi:Uma2 family endonuclease
MSALPEWMRPPREEGWFAEDLDGLTEAPRHTELLHGALVFRLIPRTVRHSRIVTALTAALADRAPADTLVERETSIRLDARNRPEPDLVVATAEFHPDRTWFEPATVSLVVEVVSPESAHRDRTVKVRKYAEAGIAHYWLIEEEDGAPVAHVYELDAATSSYAPAGIFRGKLERPVPFPVTIDLDGLVPARKRTD